jgi:hypothetical protein
MLLPLPLLFYSAASPRGPSSHLNHAYHFEYLTRNNERSMAGTGKIGQMTWVRMRKRVLEVLEKGGKKSITSGRHYS